MIKKIFFLAILFVLPALFLLTSCTDAQNEAIEEQTDLHLSDLTLARDKSLASAVQGNIETNLELQWYAKTFGIQVEVAHAVATVHMQVKTNEHRDTALQLARSTEGIEEVVDEIVVDPSLDSPPFEW